MNAIERIVSRYRLYQAQCEKRRLEIDREIEQLTKEHANIRPIHWTEGLLRPVLQDGTSSRRTSRTITSVTM